MRLITTQDSSSSIYNEEIKEGYHSSSGAMEESVKKFCMPLREYITKKNISVLDTCFGIGYRSTAFSFVFNDCNIEFTAIEIDPALLPLMKIVHVPDYVAKYYELFQELYVNYLKVSDDRVSCELILGDASSVIPTLKKKFDVVLHDPFSPRKVPELWTYELFQEIYNRMNKGGVLSTYSSSKVIRDNLRDVGFQVINGPSIGRRKPSTIALKN